MVIDGAAVDLPVNQREIAYGTSHTIVFPATVVDPTGKIYLTTQASFQGTVNANISTTARYTTMTNVVADAVASGGVASQQVTPLTSLWASVEAAIKQGNLKAAQTRCTSSPARSGPSRARRSRPPSRTRCWPLPRSSTRAWEAPGRCERGRLGRSRQGGTYVGDQPGAHQLVQPDDGGAAVLDDHRAADDGARRGHLDQDASWRQLDGGRAAGGEVDLL